MIIDCIYYIYDLLCALPRPLRTCACRYWMYACVCARDKGLLVSNDELRDHIFSLLRPKHFLKWKERHIAHYYFKDLSSYRFELDLPPPYSRCVQQLPSGAWMLPGGGTAVNSNMSTTSVMNVKRGEEEGGDEYEPAEPEWWLCIRPVAAGQA